MTPWLRCGAPPDLLDVHPRPHRRAHCVGMSVHGVTQTLARTEPSLDAGADTPSPSSTRGCRMAFVLPPCVGSFRVTHWWPACRAPCGGGRVACRSCESRPQSLWRARALARRCTRRSPGQGWLDRHPPCAGHDLLGDCLTARLAASPPASRAKSTPRTPTAMPPRTIHVDPVAARVAPHSLDYRLTNPSTTRGPASPQTTSPPH